MKGVVFTEFVEMVEESFSIEIADQMIESAELPSGGVYTSVGTYDHEEIVSLVTELARLTGLGTDDLQLAYGRHLFGRFVALYPHLIDRFGGGLDLLENVEDVVHAEVLKLYPDAQLPRFETLRESPVDLTMTYQSPRKMATLAQGLIEGCLQHFGEQATIERAAADDDEAVVFRIRCTTP